MTFYAAQRGDLALHEVKRSYTYAHYKGSNVSYYYHFVIVTNVTKEGNVTGYTKMFLDTSHSQVKPRAGVIHRDMQIVPQARIDVHAAFQALGTIEFDTVESAKAAVRPFLIKGA